MSALRRVALGWLRRMLRVSPSSLAGAYLLLFGLGPLGSSAAWADVCTQNEIDDLLNQLEDAVVSGSWEAVTTLSLWSEIDPSRNKAWKEYFRTMGKPKQVRFVDREVDGGRTKVLGNRVDLFEDDESFEHRNLVFVLRRVGGACRLDDRGGA